jgi:Flp pilus assembly protein TadG
MFRLFRRDREKGAAAVEFAIVLPLFVLLVFGIMEAGWLFAQINDIHHGAREGARLAAVNYDGGVQSEMCNRMDLASASDPVVTLTATEDVDASFLGSGDTGYVKVEIKYQSLTGVLDPIFDGRVITSEVDFRLEQPLDGGTAIAWVTTDEGC